MKMKIQHNKMCGTQLKQCKRDIYHLTHTFKKKEKSPINNLRFNFKHFQKKSKIDRKQMGPG